MSGRPTDGMQPAAKKRGNDRELDRVSLDWGYLIVTGPHGRPREHDPWSRNCLHVVAALAQDLLDPFMMLYDTYFCIDVSHDTLGSRFTSNLIQLSFKRNPPPGRTG